MNKNIFNNKGFSLIELMVVVAIIGVLAAIGVPQYAKFQAKSRQTEAKVALVALYTGEKSFQTEWNFFTVDLKNAGVAVEGNKLRYVAGFSAGTACATGAGYTGPTEATTVANTWTDGTNVNVSTPAATWLTAVTKTISGTATSCSQTAFSGAAIGDPTNTGGGTPKDQWNISEAKALTNSYIGF